MSLIRKVFSFSACTMVSRVFGYLRDVVLASKLGAGLLNDAFIVAFRLPNLFRAIFAEGALNNAFVPIYSASHDTATANQFAANTRNLLMLCLMFLCIIMILFMPLVVRAMAPGLIDEGNTITNAIMFSRITFGYIFFISLAALYGSILNAHGKFIPFASAPILLNLSIIGFLWFGDLFANNAKAASIGILTAGFLQILWVIMFLKIYKIKLPLGGLVPLKSTKTMLRRMLPIVITSGFIQINLLIDSIFASMENGAISYLYFANRLNQLPLSIIGISLGVVALPALARNFKNNKPKALAIQHKAITFALYFTIPACFALFWLSADIIYLLLERGLFDANSTSQTAKALSAYAIGLPAWVLQKVVLSAFHARGDTANPLKYSMISIGINIVLNALFFYLFGFVGVALASSLAVYINLFLLTWLAYRQQNITLRPNLLLFLLKTIICSAFMIFIVKIYLMYNFGHFHIILSFIIGFLAYIIATFMLGFRFFAAKID